MNRKIIGFLFFVLLGLSAGTAMAQSANASEDVILPRRQTAEEILNNQMLDGLPILGSGYPWECRPDVYGFTGPPPSDVRFPSEWELVNGVVLGWYTSGCPLPELIEIIRHALTPVQRTQVWLVTQFQTGAVNCLRARGFDDATISLINWIQLPVDSIWIRDYYAEILYGEDYSYHLVDMSYYPQIWSNCSVPTGRPRDDASGTRTAEEVWGGVSYYRPQLRAEGGNLQTDGYGTCFRNQRVTESQNRFSRWTYTADELNQVIADYYNCKDGDGNARVVVMESMQSYRGQTNIDHIDMTQWVLSPSRILVGEFDPVDDPANAAVLNRNAQRLMDLGYNVTRVPMPLHYCLQGAGRCPAGAATPIVCGAGSQTVNWATYLNITVVGYAALVPVYRNLPASLRDRILAQEAEALATIQLAFDEEFGPGVFEVIPVISDQIIPCLGAVHCITMTF